MEELEKTKSMEEIKTIVKDLLEISRKDSEENEWKAKQKKKEVENIRRNSMKNKSDKETYKKQIEDLEKEIGKLEEKTIQFHYTLLLENLTNYLDNLGISSLNIEDFIGPDGICQAIAKGLTFKRTQLRKFFNEVKTIKINLRSNPTDNSIRIRLLALVPKLAYSTGKKLIDEGFYHFMKTLISKLNEDFTAENFEKFEQIFEAIVAYHVYYNPTEG